MTEIDDDRWNAFVLGHRDGTFFHLSSWKRVASAVFGHKPHFLQVERDGELAAALPLVEVRSHLFGHALISNAFCVGGGPLAVDEPAREEILAKAEELGRKLGVDYVELRDTAAAPARWTRAADLYAGFSGPIACGEDDNLKQIPRKQRAVIRKSLDRGMTVTIDPDANNFFPLYSRTMRDHGTPALPRRYFDRLMAVFGPQCEILTVHHQGKPASSVVSYYFKDRVLPYYTGSRLDARASGANDLMYWSLMRRAVDRDCAIFDFGRSKVGTGAYSFKCNWGFEPRPIAHQYLLLKRQQAPELNPTNPRYSLFIKAWRRLPIPLATAVSPLLSRGLA